MSKRIQVVAYDPGWPDEFETEATRISRALGELVIRLHHIGSTAIPGIFAKPIIDFLMEVLDISALDNRNSDMEELGYEAMGEFGICRSSRSSFQLSLVQSLSEVERGRRMEDLQVGPYCYTMCGSN